MDIDTLVSGARVSRPYRGARGHFPHIRLITKDVPHGSATNDGKHSTFPTKDHGTYHETRESREQRKESLVGNNYHDGLANTYFAPHQ